MSLVQEKDFGWDIALAVLKIETRFVCVAVGGGVDKDEQD